MSVDQKWVQVNSQSHQSKRPAIDPEPLVHRHLDLVTEGQTGKPQEQQTDDISRVLQEERK